MNILSNGKPSRSVILCGWIAAATLVPWIVNPDKGNAQPTSPKPATGTTGKYSEAVVAKAEKILNDAGLRRNGKQIQSSDTSDVARAITGLSRQKRELRLVHDAWKKSVDRLQLIEGEIRKLNAQDVQLNLQLARAGDDVRTNNRIVGLINAGRAKTKALNGDRDFQKKEIDLHRAALNHAETKYAETVLAIRKHFETVREQVSKSLEDDDVKIALRVMAANFATPSSPNADTVLKVVDQRIAKIEKEIFSEKISLQRDGGALLADVVIGKKSLKMVVDSGASMVTITSKTASDLGIEVPLSARELKLVVADGRSISARAVMLPKVRIGQFEAEDVEAAVMEPSADGAEPLLGMTFLRNFKFEIDPNENTLKLLRVVAQ